MSGGQPGGIIDTGRPVSCRDTQHWKRGFALARALGDTRVLNDGRPPTLYRGMRLGPRRAWTVARLWLWRRTPRWLR